MTSLIQPDEVVRCVKQELELAVMKNKRAHQLDLTHLLPEIKFTIIEQVLLHTRGNQARASRILGINRATIRTTYNKHDI